MLKMMLEKSKKSANLIAITCIPLGIILFSGNTLKN